MQTQRIKTEAIKITDAHHDMCGQFLRWNYVKTGEISQGLAGRLVKYAAKRFLEIGIEVSNFEIEVGMVEYGCKVYHVTFKNGKGASFILNQIYVYRGWPSSDFGIELREED